MLLGFGVFSLQFLLTQKNPKTNQQRGGGEGEGSKARSIGKF